MNCLGKLTCDLQLRSPKCIGLRHAVLPDEVCFSSIATHIREATLIDRLDPFPLEQPSKPPVIACCRDSGRQTFYFTSYAANDLRCGVQNGGKLDYRLTLGLMLSAIRLHVRILAGRMQLLCSYHKVRNLYLPSSSRSNDYQAAYHPGEHRTNGKDRTYFSSDLSRMRQ